MLSLNIYGYFLLIKKKYSMKFHWKKIVKINWITDFQISLSTTNQISELTAQKKNN